VSLAAASRALARVKLRAQARPPFSAAQPLGSLAVLFGLAALGLYLHGLQGAEWTAGGLVSVFYLLGGICGLLGIIVGLLLPHRGARFGVGLSIAGAVISVAAAIVSVAAPS